MAIITKISMYNVHVSYLIYTHFRYINIYNACNVSSGCHFPQFLHKHLAPKVLTLYIPPQRIFKKLALAYEDTQRFIAISQCK